MPKTGIQFAHARKENFATQEIVTPKTRIERYVHDRRKAQQDAARDTEEATKPALTRPRARTQVERYIAKQNSARAQKNEVKV